MTWLSTFYHPSLAFLESYQLDSISRIISFIIMPVIDIHFSKVYCPDYANKH